ncbi:MAG: bifunctional adenosylcobinamide kinase/adenosylcobinamide-phosphate guanylyltransferase [Bacillota bacterium]
MFTLIIGGARSGKSSLAEEIAAGQEEKYGRQVVYLATAAAGDQEMAARIKNHQARRPANWLTVEEELYPARALRACDLKAGSVVILDCLTLLLTNHLLKEDFTPADLQAELAGLITLITDKEGLLLMVTNEVGMGLVPPGQLSRNFRDEAGRLNQWLAAQAEQVFFTVAGIPLNLKKMGSEIKLNEIGAGLNEGG